MLRMRHPVARTEGKAAVRRRVASPAVSIFSGRVLLTGTEDFALAAHESARCSGRAQLTTAGKRENIASS
eukprot:7557638-Pyramimonas_sp.AAC.1